MSAQNSERDNWKTTGPKAPPETIPPPTVYPATLSLGVTMMAFGVVTSLIITLAGTVIFLFGVAGWVEDLRND
jgi:hypothetical protein